MHYRYRGSTVHSVPSPRYYREILPIPTVIPRWLLPIPTVITAVTAVLPHSSLPCHSLVTTWPFDHKSNILTVTPPNHATWRDTDRRLTTGTASSRLSETHVTWSANSVYLSAVRRLHVLSRILKPWSHRAQTDTQALVTRYTNKHSRSPARQDTLTTLEDWSHNTMIRGGA